MEQIFFPLLLEYKMSLKKWSWPVWFSKNFFGGDFACRSQHHLGSKGLVRLKPLVEQPRIFLSAGTQRKIPGEDRAPSSGG